MTADGENDPLIEAAIAEVVGLHEAFVLWFGTAPPDSNNDSNSDSEFERIEGAFGDGFVIIGPDGEAVNRDDICKRLWAMRGTFKDNVVPFAITIKNREARLIGPDICLVRYEEWQTFGDEEKARISTAVLKRDDTAPGGLLWLNVHETWMPE